MYGLGLVIATSLSAAPIDNTFLLCATCQQPEDFAKEVTQKKYHEPGAFRDLVGNPDTGVIYVVEYVVKKRGDICRSDFGKAGKRGSRAAIQRAGGRNDAKQGTTQEALISGQRQ